MQQIIFGNFNNHDKSASIMKSDGRNVMVINKPITPISKEVFDYASDEIGAFFINACRKNKYL